MSDWAIQVDHVSKQFRFREERRNSVKEIFVKGKGGEKRTFLAVDDVSFDVAQGKTFGLVGHNGSGKSTMLKMLAGVYRPTSGNIAVRGKVSALIELGAGFHGELTGRENIGLNGTILGMSKKQIDESIDEIIDFADIGEFIDVPVKTYSSGMYVRLGFAIAVVMNPEVLIVDEIIAVGDEQFQRKCFDYLYRLRRDGSTIALVTHALGLARDLCDEGVWMNHGKAQVIGPIGEVIDSYVAEVNRQEREELETSEPEDEVIVGRQGSGEVRATRVEMLEMNGERALTLTPGQDYIARVHIDAKTDVGEVVVGLGFSLENGFMIVGPNSGQEHREYDLPRGESFVDFLIPSLFLRDGIYWITTSLASKGHTWDFVDRGWKTVVRPDENTDEAGPVRLIGRWSNQPSQSLVQEGR